MTNFCAKCGERAEVGNLFCTVCGRPLIQVVPEVAQVNQTPAPQNAAE